MKTLHIFCTGTGTRCNTGANPLGSVVADRAGTLYGATEAGGGKGKRSGGGVVYALTPNRGTGRWAEAVLYVFCVRQNDCRDGNSPSSGLTLDAKGNLFGETLFGGTGGEGTVFSLTTR